MAETTTISPEQQAAEVAAANSADEQARKDAMVKEAKEIIAGGEVKDLEEASETATTETKPDATGTGTVEELDAASKQRAIELGYTEDELKGLTPATLEAEQARRDRALLKRPVSVTEKPVEKTAEQKAAEAEEAAARIERIKKAPKGAFKLKFSEEVAPEISKVVEEMNAHYAAQLEAQQAVLEATRAKAEAATNALIQQQQEKLADEVDDVLDELRGESEEIKKAVGTVGVRTFKPGTPEGAKMEEMLTLLVGISDAYTATKKTVPPLKERMKRAFAALGFNNGTPRLAATTMARATSRLSPIQSDARAAAVAEQQEIMKRHGATPNG